MMIYKKLTEDMLFTIAFMGISMLFNMAVFLVLKIVPFPDYDFLDLTQIHNYILATMSFSVVACLASLEASELAKHFRKEKSVS